MQCDGVALKGTRKYGLLVSGPALTAEGTHLTLSILADTFALSECTAVLFHSTFVGFVLVWKQRYCLICLNKSVFNLSNCSPLNIFQQLCTLLSSRCNCIDNRLASLCDLSQTL